MSFDEFLAHKQECVGCARTRPDTSGPDLAVTLPSHSTGTAGVVNKALDVTVIEALAKSNRNSTVAQLFYKIDATKSSKYESICNAANYDYATIACLSNGHLSSQMKSFVCQLADTKRISRKNMLEDFSALVVGQTAQSTVTALRAVGIAPPSLHIDARSSPLARSFVHVDVPDVNPSAPVRQPPLLPTPVSDTQRMDAFEATLAEICAKLQLITSADRVVETASLVQEEQTLSARRARMPSIKRSSPLPASRVDPEQAAFQLRSALRDNESVRNLNAETMDLVASISVERATSIVAADNAQFKKRASEECSRQASASETVSRLAEVAALDNVTDRANALVSSTTLTSATNAVALVARNRSSLETSAAAVSSALDLSSCASSFTMAKAVLEATNGASALQRVHDRSMQQLPSGPLPPLTNSSKASIDLVVARFKASYSRFRDESPDPMNPNADAELDEETAAELREYEQSVDREIEVVEDVSAQAAKQDALVYQAEFDALCAAHSKRLERDVRDEKLLNDALRANVRKAEAQQRLHDALRDSFEAADHRAREHFEGMSVAENDFAAEADIRAASKQAVRDEVESVANYHADLAARVESLRSQSRVPFRQHERSSRRAAGLCVSPSTSDDESVAGQWLGQHSPSRTGRNLTAANAAHRAQQQQLLAPSPAPQSSNAHFASSRQPQNNNQTSLVSNAAQSSFHEMQNESTPWPQQHPPPPQPAAAATSANFFTQSSASAAPKRPNAAFNNSSVNVFAQRQAQQQPR